MSLSSIASAAAMISSASKSVTLAASTMVR
jgi:hypothetical protein